MECQLDNGQYSTTEAVVTLEDLEAVKTLEDLEAVMMLEVHIVVLMLEEQVAVLTLEDRTSDKDPKATEAVMKTRVAEAWMEN